MMYTFYASFQGIEERNKMNVQVHAILVALDMAYFFSSACHYV